MMNETIEHDQGRDHQQQVFSDICNTFASEGPCSAPGPRAAAATARRSGLPGERTRLLLDVELLGHDLGRGAADVPLPHALGQRSEVVLRCRGVIVAG